MPLAILAIVLALGPYSGPPLRGSLADSVKFSLHISGRAGAPVALRATGVPHGWLASFCTNLVCASSHVTIRLPESGQQTIELQLIQLDVRATTPANAEVRSADGAHASAPLGESTKRQKARRTVVPGAN